MPAPNHLPATDRLPVPAAAARRLIAIACLACLPACGSGSGSEDAASATTATPVIRGAVDPRGPGRGFPSAAPWGSLYGPLAGLDLARVGASFAILDIEADPDAGNATAAQIATLRAGGARVLSYLNLGSCERWRSYWASAPPGLLPCGANRAAQRGAYDGYPDETWMDLGNADHQRLILEHVAPRLAAQGIDGFYLDNLEIVEHGTATTNGPCDARCAQGGLDLVRRLREQYPAMLIVMQNATGERTRTGTTGGVPFPSLLDGIAHEEVYRPVPDPGAEAELLAWQALGLRPGGRPFFIGTLDYVGTCADTPDAAVVYAASRARGFSPYASDSSDGQQSLCLRAP